MALTEAQRDWLGAHPQYSLCGKPQPGVSFKECGTLYADGRFDLMAPMKPVKLEDGCVLIGVPSDLYLTDRGSFRGPCGECHLKIGETCDICGHKLGGIKSTPAMRARARELATPPRDDFDRAVLAILDDFDQLLAR